MFSELSELLLADFLPAYSLILASVLIATWNQNPRRLCVDPRILGRSSALGPSDSDRRAPRSLEEVRLLPTVGDGRATFQVDIGITSTACRASCSSSWGGKKPRCGVAPCAE